MVITSAQLHSTKYGIKFCAGSSATLGVSEISNSEYLRMVLADNKAKRLFAVNHTAKAINHHHHHHRIC